MAMSEVIPEEAYIEARVTLIPADAGGRKRPIASGYRCGFLIGNPYGDREQQNDAAVCLVDAAELAPGEAALARIRPAVPASWTSVNVGATLPCARVLARSEQRQ
jgi:hypothetical protein